MRTLLWTLAYAGLGVDLTVNVNVSVHDQWSTQDFFSVCVVWGVQARHKAFLEADNLRERDWIMWQGAIRGWTELLPNRFSLCLVVACLTQCVTSVHVFSENLT